MKFKPEVDKKKSKKRTEAEKQAEKQQQARGDQISKYCAAVVDSKLYSKMSSHSFLRQLITNKIVQGYLLPRLQDIKKGTQFASMHGLAGPVKSYRKEESEQFKRRKDLISREQPDFLHFSTH